MEIRKACLEDIENNLLNLYQDGIKIDFGHESVEMLE